MTSPPPSGPVIRVGIAGLGRSGWRNHLLPLSELSDLYRVVAVTDLDADRVREARDRTGCHAAADLAALAADDAIDLIVVCTPSHLHAGHCTAALASGKDVVCEKPMALSLAEAERMLAEAAARRRLLTVFSNRRYEPDFLRIRSVIAAGELGEILSIQLRAHRYVRRLDWQAWLGMGGGAVRNTAWHLLDQALLLADGTLTAPGVTAQLARALGPGDGEDYAKIVLTAPGAPFVSVEISDVCAYPQPDWLIMGAYGTLVGSHDQLTWRWVRPGDLTPVDAPGTPPPRRDYPVDRLAAREASWRRPVQAPSPSLWYYRDLHAAVSGGAALPVAPAEIRLLQRIIDDCLRQGSKDDHRRER